MAGCENINIGTGEKGCLKVVKQPTSIFIFEKETKLDILSLKDKSFIEDLIISSTDRCSILQAGNFVEETPAEAEFHTPDYGAKLKTSSKAPVKMIKHQSTQCLRALYDKLDGATVHVLLGTEGSYIQGVAVENDKLKTAKATINMTTEFIDKVEYKNFELSFYDLFDDLKRDVKVDYDVKQIENLTGLNIYPKTATTTDLTFELTDCSLNAYDGADVSNFELNNLTTGAVVTGTFSDDNNGEYSVTYSSGVSLGDVLKVIYTGPDASNKFIQNLTTNITIV